MAQEDDLEPDWVGPTHQSLLDAGVGIVGHVPDGGLRHLITRVEHDHRITTVRLSTEEEGVALAAGAWLGGVRTAVLMQSSGVGNCINMLSLLRTCAVPTVFLVTMRGQGGESNPWQVPMGSVADQALELMGVEVRSVSSVDAVAAAVARSAAEAFGPTPRATAVLIEQQVIGAKQFAGDRP